VISNNKGNQMSKQSLHVVIGATGGTGGALVRELVARGERVRAVNRSGWRNAPQQVEVVQADALDAQQMKAACRGASVVYNCVNPPFTRWAELFPPVMENLIGAAGAHNATLVFADDTWMYGRVHGSATEEQAQHPEGYKGELRARLAERLMQAHARGEVRAVIGRAAELFGPQVESLIGANVFRAALTGKRALWPANLDSPINPLFIDDFARGLIVLGQEQSAAGQIWHVPANQAITGREFVQIVFEEAGQKLKLSALKRPVVQALGMLWPIAREGVELLYQFETPYIIDSSKFQNAFGGAATPYRDGIRQTLAWYRSQLEAQNKAANKAWWRAMWRYGSSKA
jgi:nucleoside-diphosphate-sugar epimerase